MKSLTLHTAETTDMSTQKCTHIKADAAVLTGRHREPLQHRGPVAFHKYFLLVGPSLFLSEWESGSKSSLCVMRSLSEGNTIRVERGRKRGFREDRRAKVCIARGKGGKQQGAGQGRKKKQASDPLSSDPLCSEHEGSTRRTPRKEPKSCFWSRPEVSPGSRSTGCGSFRFCGGGFVFFNLLLKPHNEF